MPYSEVITAVRKGESRGDAEHRPDGNGARMELLDVTLTGIQRRNRAVFVRRCEVPGSPVLVPGQRVVLRDEEGEYFAGTVVDVHDEAEESYLVNLGVRLPEEFAMMRLGRQFARSRDDEDVQELLDMLGEARGVVMPLQRRVD